MAQEITSLDEMFDRVEDSADDEERVSLGKIVESVGNRSFGPLLLLVGVIMTSPLSGMPGMPTTMGVLLFLIAGQLIFGRDRFWLPRWLLRRSVSREKIRKGIRWLRPAARFIDRWLRPRLSAFISGASTYLISLVCAVIAVTMPMMEVVPFTVHGAGLAVTAFGLALISRDGLLALVAFIVTAGIFGTITYHWFS